MANRQFTNEQGLAKVAHWLGDAVEKKKNAEKTIKSLLLQCTDAKIPGTLPSFDRVRSLIKDLASDTEHEDITRLAAKLLVKFGQEDDNEVLEIVNEGPPALPATSAPPASTTPVSILRGDGKSGGEKHVRFSDQNTSDNGQAEEGGGREH